MVRQQFAGVAVAQPATNAPTNNSNSNSISNNNNNTSQLAMPAIIATNQQQVVPNSNAVGQYSPQANFYQQQLIKSAQQQFMQQNNVNRLNGHPQTQQHYSANQQQDSPSANQQQVPLEGLYNGLARPGPVYAPKPTYYGQSVGTNPQQQQQQQQQQHHQTQSMYQTGPPRPIQQPAPTYYQQQHSPASLTRSMQNGLSVRQMPVQVNGVLAVPQQLSPNLQPNVEQQQIQQQQMQQLIMSYHQHQQLSNMQNNSQEPIQVALESQQQAISASHLQNGSMQPQIGIQEQLVQQHVDVRWSQLEEQQRQQIQHQRLLSHSNLVNERTVRSSRFSDRDSVSTVNRFNQFDERRSITMRSQYTNANQSNRYSNQFGFLKLTGEALKRILGFTSGTNEPLIAKFQGANARQHNLQRNLNLSLTNANNTNSNSDKNIHNPFNSNHNSSTAKITALDAGEDYYFKRKVFKYQLVILRLISLLSAAFVLLSPVAMLLIPKMESIFHPHEYTDSTSSTQSLSNNDNQASSQLATATPSITHAVGLAGANKQQLHHRHQQPYFAPQPQWRISECTSDCDGPLIGFVVRLIMLSIAYWAIFFRAQTVTLPRLDFYRCLLTSVAVLLTLAYWLFFIFRVFDKRYNDFELQYMTIVQFALSMLESLILLHYLAVVLLELRQRKKIYCLKVVRSPDGASKYYSCGSLSIQKCGQFVLEKYHRDFKSYSSYAEQLLELEDQLAQNIVASRGDQGDKSPNHHTSRSRANSPANSAHRGDTLGGRSGRRSASRNSRHHSRNGAGGSSHHRSPSESPVRSSRSRSQRKALNISEKSNTATATSTARNNSNQVKLYQVDLNPPESNSKNKNSSNSNDDDGQHQQNTSDRTSSQLAHKTFQEHNSTEIKQQENDSNSADQSSDATSRMKESSLETIRAANSTSDLLSQQQKTSASTTNMMNTRADNNDDHQHRLTRDETESVRSVRSRRSTTRSHHRHRSEHRSERGREREHHHQNHRERSSSRVADDAQDDHRHGHRSINIQMPMADPIEDHEQKLRRRKLRLLAAVQDTFEKIKKSDEVHHPNNQPSSTGSSTSLNGLHAPKQELDPNQAARSMYPSIARSLQKYLRLTKQTGRHNLQSIYEHLSKCVLYNLSPRAFLEKFLSQDPVWQQNETNLFASCRLEDSTLMCSGQARSKDLEINSWSLICDTLLSRQVDSGTFFILKQGQVSLLVTVARLPHLNLSEELVDQKSCKFTLEPHPVSSV